jgi:hypothetical protein
MSVRRARRPVPCWLCTSAACALDGIVDAAQIRIATLERELQQARARAAQPRSVRTNQRNDRPSVADVQELRARVAELETANAQLRHVADAERRRADAGRDGLARAYRMALDVTGRRA